jgi:hypothetical protein
MKPGTCYAFQKQEEEMEYMRMFISLGVMLFSILLCACRSADNGNDSFYPAMIARSLVSGGNNYRIKHFM